MPERNGTGHFRSSLMKRYGFTAIFSLRAGGVSPPPFDSLNLGRDLGDSSANVEVNLDRLTKAASIGRPHQAKQVHGERILMCSGPGRHHDTEADILLSLSGDALAVRVADCLPILLADIHSGMIAAVHAGWRGTVANVAGKAALKMLELGATPDGLLAMLGPCIGSCCFAIDQVTARLLAGSAAGAENFVHPSATCHADLRAINTLQLRQAGILSGHIETREACTCCDRSSFFSYRRDGARTGRHLAMIAATSPSGGIAEAAVPS